ncbi:MAG: LysR family transcriptional regulator [Desulfobulbus oligotrophicus]|jgi:DNA-binding transcriptional LysR family regulator|nr:LysR family transcriptional regulator [Desulfobulbus oligotrophicus]
METIASIRTLAGKDLNLLVVFRAVAETGSVTKAAHLLSLSQPAVSHALRRLRESLDDPLFVRGKSGLVLTSHAQTLIEPVKDVLARADSIFARASFDPARENRVFRLAASDFTASTMFPRLFQKLRAVAPGIRLDVSNVHRNVFDFLEEGSLDLCFIINNVAPKRFRSVDLLSDKFVGVMHKNHPLTSSATQPQGISMEDYLAYPHVEVSINDSRDNLLRKKLHELGYERNVRAFLPNFASGLATLEGTDLLMTIPRRLGASFIKMFGLVAFPLPFDLESHTHIVIWHERTDNEPGLSWLRQLIVINSQFID